MRESASYQARSAMLESLLSIVSEFKNLRNLRSPVDMLFFELTSAYEDGVSESDPKNA